MGFIYFHGTKTQAQDFDLAFWQQENILQRASRGEKCDQSAWGQRGLLPELAEVKLQCKARGTVVMVVAVQFSCLPVSSAQAFRHFNFSAHAGSADGMSLAFNLLSRFGDCNLSFRGQDFCMGVLVELHGYLRIPRVGPRTPRTQVQPGLSVPDGHGHGAVLPASCALANPAARCRRVGGI